MYGGPEDYLEMEVKIYKVYFSICFYSNFVMHYLCPKHALFAVQHKYWGKKKCRVATGSFEETKKLKIKRNKKVKGKQSHSIKERKSGLPT